ncbi:MAG: hypothetical protein K0R72_797 [Clostridia bacterium]|jgi:hypothetical protein|nr:hypothetical protein [Clostridia bacterium]
MAKFENLGYCPYNEIVNSQEKVWNELSEAEKAYRRALWELVGPYMVCDTKDTSYSVQSSKLFFGTRYLANEVLKEVIRRYDFAAGSPIWIKQPRNGNSTDVNVAKYVVKVKDPEILFDSTDAGKLVVVSNGEDGEIIVAFWDKSI